MPVERHVMMMVTRHRRKDRVEAISNLAIVQGTTFDYYDSVTIEYQRPASSSNSGLLPLSEPAYLFYRGEAPDAGRTKWFRDGSNNATTVWDVAAQPGEGEPTQHQRFCWELHQLMMSLTTPRTHNRFNLVCPIGQKEYDRLFQFCRVHSIGVNICTDDEDQASEIIEQYRSNYG